MGLFYLAFTEKAWTLSAKFGHEFSAIHVTNLSPDTNLQTRTFNSGSGLDARARPSYMLMCTPCDHKYELSLARIK